MTKTHTWLVKWKICDADGTLSLSNVMLAVIIVRLAFTPTLDWTTLSGLSLALMNHNARKWFAKDKVAKIVSDQEKLVALTNDVKTLSNALSFKGIGK
jgi:hypothetical protein